MNAAALPETALPETALPAAALLLAALLLPLLLAALRPRFGAGLLHALPFAALPALAAALLVPAGTTLELPWLLLGTHFALDATGSMFLAASAALWTAGGLAARAELCGHPQAARIALCWLLVLAGNIGVLIAGDVASFNALFALMTFAAWGLIDVDGRASSRRAARTYLTLSVLGESMIISALLLAVAATGETELQKLSAALGATATAQLVIPLFLAGFGVKAGLPLLHIWMPLAYRAGPVAAAAVLGGATLAAGLFAWTRMLPLGSDGMEHWGTKLILTGLTAAFGGALVGITQRDARQVLAYSSVSQVGLVTLMLGAGLRMPELWTTLLPVVTLFAVHHTLAKGVLFLGVGAAARGLADARGARRAWLVAGLALPMLALVGAPATSGAAAKLAMKSALGEGGGDPLIAVAATLLGPATIATTLLMGRYAWCLVRPSPGASESAVGAGGTEQDPMPAGTLGAWLPAWGTGLALVLCGVFLLPLHAASMGPIVRSGVALHAMPGLLWPVLTGVVLSALAAYWVRRAPLVPPGDLLVPLESVLRALAALLRRASARLSIGVSRSSGWSLQLLAGAATGADRATAAEAPLRTGFALGFLAVLAALWLLSR